MAVVMWKVASHFSEGSEDKVSMSTRLLNDTLIMLDAAKSYPNVIHIPISKEVLILACGARKL